MSLRESPYHITCIAAVAEIQLKRIETIISILPNQLSNMSIVHFLSQSKAGSYNKREPVVRSRSSPGAPERSIFRLQSDHVT